MRCRCGGSRRHARSASERTGASRRGSSLVGFGGVLRDVGGHAAGPLVAFLEDLYVNLGPPRRSPPRMDQGDGVGRMQAGEGELSGVDWRDRTIRSVGADDGVQVNDATALELSHPAEGEPRHPTGVGLRATQHGGELALGINHRAAPQLGGARVLEHCALVVVTIGAEGVSRPARRLAKRSCVRRRNSGRSG